LLLLLDDFIEQPFKTALATKAVFTSRRLIRHCEPDGTASLVRDASVNDLNHRFAA
jgi:hypothetical protein